MQLILAIDADKRQAEQLAGLVRGRLAVELLQATSSGEALQKLGERVPDLIMTSPLLSPFDEGVLAEYLRDIGPAGIHVQTLRIPVLSAPKPTGRGLFSFGRKRQPTFAPDGCDPDFFADEIAVYLARAAEERRSTAAKATSPAPEDLARAEAVFASEPLAAGFEHVEPDPYVHQWDAQADSPTPIYLPDAAAYPVAEAGPEPETQSIQLGPVPPVEPATSIHRLDAVYPEPEPPTRQFDAVSGDPVTPVSQTDALFVEPSPSTPQWDAKAYDDPTTPLYQLEGVYAEPEPPSLHEAAPELGTSFDPPSTVSQLDAVHTASQTPQPTAVPPSQPERLPTPKSEAPRVDQAPPRITARENARADTIHAPEVTPPTSGRSAAFESALSAIRKAWGKSRRSTPVALDLSDSAHLHEARVESQTAAPAPQEEMLQVPTSNSIELDARAPLEVDLTGDVDSLEEADSDKDTASTFDEDVYELSASPALRDLESELAAAAPPLVVGGPLLGADSEEDAGAQPRSARRHTDKKRKRVGEKRQPGKASKPATGPVQDEWGLFDPSRCGFTALADRLAEASNEDDNPKARRTTVRVISYR